MPSLASQKPRKLPAQQRSKETVQAILEAAAQLFERDGSAATSTNRIAARAGVSIGSLYQYFPNKEAIVIELVRGHLLEAENIAWPTLEQMVREVPPLHDGLAAIVYGMVALHQQAPGLHRVLFEEAPRSAELRQLERDFFDKASRLIGEYLRATPEATIRDSALAGRMVAHVVDQVTHGAVIHPRGDEDPEVYARETLAMLERYLTG